MKDLVILEKGKVPLTSSIIIAEGMKLSHLSVIRLIDKYVERLNRMGEVVRFEIEKPKGKLGGRPVRLAWLDKKQFLFLATLMRNSEVVLNFKEKLIDEFERLQKIVSTLIVQRQNAEWLEKREQGKVSRQEETDAIKEFIDYAESQGSTNYVRFGYSIISKMENQALFVVEQEYPNLRNCLSWQQLHILSSADIAVARALRDGMDKKMHYKDIYKMAKDRLETFAEIVGKTIVPAQIILPHEHPPTT